MRGVRWVDWKPEGKLNQSYMRIPLRSCSMLFAALAVIVGTLAPACSKQDTARQDEPASAMNPDGSSTDAATAGAASSPTTDSGTSSTAGNASGGSSGRESDAGTDTEAGGMGGGLGRDKPSALPIHFVGLASGAELVAKTQSFTYDKYPACDPKTNAQGEFIITECVARAIVDTFNDELEVLTGVRLFSFGSFEVRPYSLQHEMKAPSSANIPREFWNAEFIHSDALTVVMPEVVNSPFMCTDRAIFGQPGLWFAVPAGASKWQLLYSLARMMGLLHGLPSGETYEDCGGFDYPPLPTDPCACESHPSGPINPDASCDVCDLEPTLDTPTHGQLSRHVGNCWLSKLHRCSFGLNAWNNRVHCVGAEGDVTCSCPMATPDEEPLTFTVSSCATTAEGERLEKAKEVCGMRSCQFPDQPEIVCEGFETEDSLPCACPSGRVFYYTDEDPCTRIENAAADPARCDPTREECWDPFGHGDTELHCFEFQGEIRCLCPETDGQTYFIVDSCEPGERASRLAQAETVCGVNACEIAERPDVDCLGLGTETSVDCKCPGGELFYLPADCTGADFTQGVDQICGAP